ncbi:unnamed protein product [Candidula unifasciata]|uniref:C-type lectin domain-containing protein n=1 Tax=Candidula unifasciata TaxID=100452 RepID=A0A8S3YRB9_9EUPU|nr:unnamed protein product [Candidula unifasciata]
MPETVLSCGVIPLCKQAVAQTTYWSRICIPLACTSAELQAYGCDQGWTDYNDYCYRVLVGQVTADTARDQCRSFGGSLSSVWSPEEKSFIISHWQYPNSETDFLWIGLRGSSTNGWVYDDNSAVKIKHGGNHSERFCSCFYSMVFPGLPAATSHKCVALRNSGSLAFLDCTLTANAFVCKKALPKVFITTSLLNRTGPVAVSPVGHAQLFERMFPTALTALPGDNMRLAEVAVASEVGCAFRCFSVSGCQVFQVSCQSSHNCESLQCVLFSDFSQ